MIDYIDSIEHITPEMLQKLRNKIQGTETEKRITLHKCEKNKIGISGNIDFALALYVIHEVPNQKEFLSEIRSILKPSGQLFIAEPRLGHVSKKAFEETIRGAKEVGFQPIEKPKVFLSWTALLKID